MANRYVTQRVKVRPADGQRFVLTRWEWATRAEADECLAEQSTAETEGATYEVAIEGDEIPPAPPPAPAPPPPDPQIAADAQTCKDYLTSATLDAFLALPVADPAQLTAAMKATIRAERAKIRLMRRVVAELAP